MRLIRNNLMTRMKLVRNRTMLTRSSSGPEQGSPELDKAQDKANQKQPGPGQGLPGWVQVQHKALQCRIRPGT
jgi:hypothetical protein